MVKMPRATTVSFAFGACVLLPAAAGAQTFTILPLGINPVRAISADASVIVGTNFVLRGPGCCIGVYRAGRWTSNQGWQSLGDPPEGWTNTFASACSADGSLIIGCMTVGDGNPGPGLLRAHDGNPQSAFLWTEETGVVAQPTLPSGYPQFMSADGGVIVSGYGNGLARWTSDRGMEILEGTEGWFVRNMSADGSTVLASAFDFDHGPEDCFEKTKIWTVRTGAATFGSPSGCWYATACSADGSVVFGGGFRWTAESEFELFQPAFGSVYSVSADGLTAVGSGRVDEIGHDGAMLWHPSVGSVVLADYLASFGVDLQGWFLARADAITPDGTIIIGQGLKGGFGGVYRAVIPAFAACAPDLNADSTVDDADFPAFVAAYQLAQCDKPSLGCTGDFNRDGTIDDRDFAVFVRAYERIFCGS